MPQRLVVVYCALSVYLQGRAWVNDVRKCLMKKLMPLYNRGFDCDTIKRTAFATHVDCYLNNGFCKISSTKKNIKALYKVYEPKDFFGKDAGEAWLQVQVFYCLINDSAMYTWPPGGVICTHVHMYTCTHGHLYTWPPGGVICTHVHMATRWCHDKR